MNKGYYKIIFYAICFITILCGVFLALIGDHYSLASEIFLIVIGILLIDIVFILINKIRKR